MSKINIDQLEIGKEILKKKDLEIPCVMLPQSALQLADEVMTEADKGALLSAIAAYVLRGEVVNSSPVVNTLMAIIRKDLDRDRATYAYTVAHSAYAGWCSANKKQNREQLSFEEWLPTWLDK